MGNASTTPTATPGKEGAAPHRVPSSQHQFLMEACASGCARSIYSCLVESPALLNAKDTHMRTPLNIAAEYGHAMLVADLMAWGADPDAPDDQQQTPLMKAAVLGDCTIGQILLTRGAQVNLQDENGNTALMLCACHERLEFASLLIRFGADVDRANHNKMTPLMRSAKNKGGEVATVLLTAGARLSVVDDNGCTAAEHARRYGRPELAEEIDSLARFHCSPPSRVRAMSLTQSSSVDGGGLMERSISNGSDSSVMASTPPKVAARVAHRTLVSTTLTEAACAGTPTGLRTSPRRSAIPPRY